MTDVDPAETDRLLRDQAAPMAARIAKWTAGRWPPIPPHDDLDDRAADALIGAWEAVQQWQASDRETPLRGYVSTSVTRRIVDGRRERLGKTATLRAQAERRTASLDMAIDSWADGRIHHAASSGGVALLPQSVVAHVEPGYQAVEDAADYALLTERVDRAVDRLAAHDETLAEAARWVWLQGGTQASLAQRVGLTEGAIAYRLRRARAWLQPLLADVA